jgi:O-antigen ligase
MSLPIAWQPRPSGTPIQWTVFAVLSGVAIGVASTIGAIVAVGVVVAIVIALIAAMRPESILAILSISIFLELVSLGGVSISRLIAPVALLIVLIELIRGGASVRMGAPLAWVIGYSLWAMASGLWTVSLAGTTFLLLSLAIALVYMLAFAALLNSRRELERILYIFAFASLFVGALTFLAFFGKLKLSGSELQGGRSQGGTGDPSFFAAYQLVALPLVLTLAAHARARWLRIGLYCAVLAIIGSMFTSLSRGGFIALAVVIPLILALPAGAFFASRTQKRFLLLLVVLAAAAVMIRAPTQIVTRVDSIFSEQGSGTSQGSGRVNLWRVAKDTIREHPYFGIGYGSFRPVSNDRLLATPGTDLQHYTLRPSGAEAHNLYLGTAAELGLPGLLLYLGIMGSTAVALRQTARRAAEAGELFIGRVANALVLSLLGWAIASTFISTETTRAFWIIVGLALALPKLIPESVDASGSSRSRRRPPLVRQPQAWG